MAEVKQTNSGIEGRPSNTQRRAPSEDVLAFGEALTEDALRMVAGGAAVAIIWCAQAGYDLKSFGGG